MSGAAEGPHATGALRYTVDKGQAEGRELLRFEDRSTKESGGHAAQSG